MTALTPDYTVEEVAQALQMSERWVRRAIAEGAAHRRYGHKIRFSPEQVEALRASFDHVVPTPGITTGRRRTSA